MKISDAIKAADELRPNTIADTAKARWLQQFEQSVERMMLDVRGLVEAVRNYSRGIYDKRMLACLVERGIITPVDYRAITAIPDTEDIVPTERGGKYPAEDWTLLLPAEHEEVYIDWLVAQIDYYNQEADNYQNDKAMFDERWGAAQAWWRQSNRPKVTSGWVV